MSLSVTGLTVSYGKNAVLRDVAFQALRGEITGLVGCNGTGKSTLLRSVAGLISHDGTIALGNGGALAPRHRAARIAYMPQDHSATSSLSVFEMILLGQVGTLGLAVDDNLKGEAEVMLGEFGMTSLANRSMHQLSGGQRQLVYLAQALFRKPDVLLLGEPTASLDLRHQLIVLTEVARHARNRNIIVIAAMHDLTLTSRFCDKVICLGEGTIVANGKPADVIDADLILKLYGVEAEIVLRDDEMLCVIPLSAPPHHALAT